MTDVKKLLDAATPLPWWDAGYMDYGHDDTFGCNVFGSGSSPGFSQLVTSSGYEGLEGSVSHGDAALIVHAVNHLPDYEAAVSLAGEIVDGWFGSGFDPAKFGELRAVLRRLRGER